MSDRVERHMTSPAMTVPDTCSVQQAADIMLRNQIRRLPIVDDEGRPLGWVCHQLHGGGRAAWGWR